MMATEAMVVRKGLRADTDSSGLQGRRSQGAVRRQQMYRGNGFRCG